MEKYIATYAFTMMSGIGIIRIEGDYCYNRYVVSFYDDSKPKYPIIKNKIFYNAKGEPYIVKNRVRLYLSDFMRTDFGA